MVKKLSSRTTSWVEHAPIDRVLEVKLDLAQILDFKVVGWLEDRLKNSAFLGGEEPGSEDIKTYA